jgi:hypothetical protein
MLLCHLTQSAQQQSHAPGVVLQARTNGIAKFDLTSKADEACIGRITFPDGHHGGEAFYVPRHEDPAKCDGE